MGQTGTGSSKHPKAWSNRTSSIGPKRDETSVRGNASNWPIRVMPNSPNSRAVSAGSRRASMGKE